MEDSKRENIPFFFKRLGCMLAAACVACTLQRQQQCLSPTVPGANVPPLPNICCTAFSVTVPPLTHPKRFLRGRCSSTRMEVLTERREKKKEKKSRCRDCLSYRRHHPGSGTKRETLFFLPPSPEMLGRAVRRLLPPLWSKSEFQNF